MPNPLELQALALHFLLKDGLNVNDADQSKTIALAHLLSGTKIPIENGRENISNSSIKATFDEMWQQQDEHHLANLRILLQSFKPFEDSSSGTMRSTLQAIEREIAKTEIRLKAEAS